jgi:hypothetical protein
VWVPHHLNGLLLCYCPTGLPRTWFLSHHYTYPHSRTLVPWPYRRTVPHACSEVFWKRHGGQCTLWSRCPNLHELNCACGGSLRPFVMEMAVVSCVVVTLQHLPRPLRLFCFVSLRVRQRSAWLTLAVVGWEDTYGDLCLFWHEELRGMCTLAGIIFCWRRFGPHKALRCVKIVLK